jgi:hypothetical protein
MIFLPIDVWSYSIQNPPRLLMFPGNHSDVSLARWSVASYFAGQMPKCIDRNMRDGSSLSDEPGATATSATVRLLLNTVHPSVLELPTVASEQRQGLLLW